MRDQELNQRPLGYECVEAMSGNPLISRELSAAASSAKWEQLREASPLIRSDLEVLRRDQRRCRFGPSSRSFGA